VGCMGTFSASLEAQNESVYVAGLTLSSLRFSFMAFGSWLVGYFGRGCS